MRRDRVVALVLVLLALSSAATLALAAVGTVVTTRAELARVGFGMPVAWLLQDQSRLDPPLPSRQHPGLPQEYPTSVSTGALAVDLAVTAVAIVLVVVLVVGLVVVTGRRRSRRR